MQLPSVKQLQYLIAVNETKHFGRAAEKCFVTQSALSTGIRELENILGIKLFERSRKQISTTPLGEQLGEQAKTVLAELGKLAEMAEHNSAPLSGPLRLGLIPTITPFLLPRLLPQLRENFPKIEFFLTEGLTLELHAQLINGDIDAMLVALPMDLPGTTQQILFSDPLLLAYREETKLLDPAVWSPTEESLQSLMLLEDGHCLQKHSMELLSSDGALQINPFMASSLSTLVHMVESDLGFTLLPMMAKGTPILKGAGIKLSPVPGNLSDSNSKRDIALVWRENTVRADDFEQIGGFIANVME